LGVSVGDADEINQLNLSIVYDKLTTSLTAKQCPALRLTF